MTITLRNSEPIPEVQRAIGSFANYHNEVHNIEEKTKTAHPKPTLLNIPAEIRLRIFSHIFHKHDFPFRSSMQEIPGCECGKSLSITNKHLYNETRNLYFNNVKISFNSPTHFKRWLGGVTSATIRELGIISVESDNSFLDVTILEQAFRELVGNSNSALHTLFLRFPRYHGGDESGYPAFVPQYPGTNKASNWDLEMRPIRHSLAKVSSLERLCVEGDPGRADIEEAILKLVLHMKANASCNKKYFQEECIMEHWRQGRYLHCKAKYEDDSVIYDSYEAEGHMDISLQYIAEITGRSKN
jgi:hypothetical protein